MVPAISKIAISAARLLQPTPLRRDSTYLYSNTESENSNGDPCDTPCISNFCKCENQFTFCLRPLSGSHNTDTGDCTLGASETTGVFRNSDGDSFDDVVDLGNGVPNPVLYTGNSWPVSLVICIYHTMTDIYRVDLFSHSLTVGRVSPLHQSSGRRLWSTVLQFC